MIKRVKRQYETLAAPLDKREHFFKTLKVHYRKYSSVPPEYTHALELALDEKKSWRKSFWIKLKLFFASIICVIKNYDRTRVQ